MWKDTNNGSVKQFETRQKEVVTVEIKKKEGVAVIAGMRDNQVKIWNDLLFDPVSYHQIKTKMEALLVKKEAKGNDKSKRR